MKANNASTEGKAWDSRAEGDLQSAVAELREDCCYLKYGHCETLACFRNNGCAIARVVFALHPHSYSTEKDFQ